MEDLMIKIDNVKKQYRLGAIGGGTLQGDLQTWWAKVRGKEDPNSKIGAKVYKKNEKFMALDGISFEVKNGERVGIIGHNGAGKSTLLKLLSRVTAPTEGQICLNGRVASMLEVGTGFHGELTGRENIYMNGAILGMTKAEIDAKMEDIIEFSECRQFIDTPVKRYSSGMYVKLAFSVAAHLDSEIMIMDEVLAVGDMAFQKKCLEKMSQVSETEGRTILYVSHNMNTIRQLCDRVVVLDHGKVTFDGDVEEGIGIYLGINNNGEFPAEYDFSNIERVYQFGQIIKVNSLSFLDKKSAEFHPNEMLRIRLNLSSQKEVEEAYLVLRIKDKNNNQKIATALSKPFGLKQNSNKILVFSLNIFALCADEYSFSIEIIGIDTNGNYYAFDNPGIVMPVKVYDSMITDVRWAKHYWGNVRMTGLEIEE